MRILLQQRPAAGEPPRYLQLTLQPDLFGGWELLRESGQLGGRAQLRREQYLLQAEATAAFEKARDGQLKRGYQLMFVSGAEPPPKITPPPAYNTGRLAARSISAALRI